MKVKTLGVCAAAAALTLTGFARPAVPAAPKGVRPAQWEGLRVGVLGDSITDPQQGNLIWWECLEKWLGWDAKVYGISGHQWCHIPGQTDRMIAEMGDDVDAVLIFIGTNDYAGGRPLGRWFDETPGQTNWWGKDRNLMHRTPSRDPATVRGCINVALEKLKVRYPDAQIVLLTPTKRWFFQCSKSNVQPEEEWTNTIGLRLEDYVKCVKEAGEIWSCPVIDLNGESGLLPSVPGYLKYFRSRERDGLHPNTAGHVRLAQLVYHRLSALPGSFRGDLRAAEEVRMRGGIANFLAKARAGGKATVAYLGGSITEQQGWRVKTAAWLKKALPAAQIVECDAAIGGTGSDLGAFRVGHDVLAAKPDLMFVEFSVNDGGVPTDDIVRNMEGIVRRTWRVLPRTDIVFAYTITVGNTNAYLKGELPVEALAHEKVAERYGIPSVCFGPRVTGKFLHGKLRFDAGEIETAVPAHDPEHDRKVRELLAADGRILFSNDGVHPRDEGHELYFESIREFFAQAEGRAPFDHAKSLAAGAPLDGRNAERAEMAPVTDAMLSGAWHMLEKTDPPKQRRLRPRMGDIRFTDTPGAKVSFRFSGGRCCIYTLFDTNSGTIRVTVDGVSREIPLFDSYCTYNRIVPLEIFSGADGEHTAVIELLEKEPDRSPVAFRFKDPATALASPRYHGRKFWISHVLASGGNVKPLK